MKRSKLITGVVVGTAITAAMMFMIYSHGEVKANPKGMVAVSAITDTEVPTTVSDEELLDTINMDYLTSANKAMVSTNILNASLKSIGVTKGVGNSGSEYVDVKKAKVEADKVAEEEKAKAEPTATPTKTPAKQSNTGKTKTPTATPTTAPTQQATPTPVATPQVQQSQPVVVADPYYDEEAAQLILNEINARRAANGLGAVGFDSDAQALAETLSTQLKSANITNDNLTGGVAGKWGGVNTYAGKTSGAASARYEESKNVLALGYSFASYSDVTGVGVKVYVHPTDVGASICVSITYKGKTVEEMAAETPGADVEAEVTIE